MSGLTAVLSAYMSKNGIMSLAFWPVPVFFALMPLLQYGVNRLMKAKKDALTMSIMAYRAIKLLFALILIMVCLWTMSECRLEFAIVFFVFYFVLTVVETVHFINRQKQR